jgi:hypothetical protein
LKVSMDFLKGAPLHATNKLHLLGFIILSMKKEKVWD